MEPFDRFWQWPDKALDSLLPIPAELHRAVMELAPDDRWNRKKGQRRCSARRMIACEVRKFFGVFGK